MDPLTHALTGAAVAWVATRSRLGNRALLIGAAAALAPDLDVFIRSDADPLLAIEHHRGFTHALVFAPVGGAVVAALLRGRASFRPAWLAAMLAWLSHGLLDAATTYGTQLFWPFSSYRVGLDIISILDPLLTLVLLFGVVAAIRARERFVYAVLVFMVVWLLIGFVQRERATAAQGRLAIARGERIERGAVFPTFGNTVVWRSLYRTNGTLRMDRIRVPWFGDATVASGAQVPAFTEVPRDARARRDLTRFAWFSDQWLAADPANPNLIGDARYSLEPNTWRPVWGIELEPTRWVNRSTERRVSIPALWQELNGSDEAFVGIAP